MRSRVLLQKYSGSMAASAKRILIAPLDWGLGHTTRCIPIIRGIMSLGHEVVFAGDKRQLAFIKETFPQIDSRLLEGYRVRYSRRALMLTLMWQMPRLLNTIRKEHRWMQQLVTTEQIDGIISDNRYGLWHPQKPTVIVTHQPGVLTGLGKMADAFIRRAHYRFLNRFATVWIPDLERNDGLAGELSHPTPLPRGAAYIGWLSQFEPAKTEGHQHILILLSGPEPQRSMLSDLLWAQAKGLQRTIVFVEGKADATRNDRPAHIRHIPLANAEILQPLIEHASLIICRSGYSTLMDLAILGKKAILIPTPGQTEQEYLARSLAQRGIFHTEDQKGISLRDAIPEAESESNEHVLPEMAINEDLLMPVLRQWTESL